MKGIFKAITYPFTCLSVLLDDSRRINEDGSWNEYNRRRNEKMIRKAGRKHKKI